MIYTGFFDKLEEYKKNNLVPVSITGKAPDSYDGAQYKKLAPKWPWWKKWHDELLSDVWYKEQYYQTVLNVVLLKDVLKDLSCFGENIVLLCYEKNGAFCHRHLVAAWLRSNGVMCKEYNLERNEKWIKAK